MIHHAPESVRSINVVRGAWRQFYTTITVLSAFSILSSAVAQPSVVEQWTAERRDALVYIEMQGRRGTGILVKSERNQYFVLTAAHNLFGVAEPSVANNILPSPITLGQCYPVEVAVLTLRRGTDGGTPLVPECMIYLGGIDIAAVRIREPSSPTLMRLDRFQAGRHNELAFLGFAFGGQREANPTLATYSRPGGPRNSVVFRAIGAPGLSGAPYLSHDGHVVGIHSGTLTADGTVVSGHLAMVPLTNVGDELERLGLGFSSVAPDLPAPMVVAPPLGPSVLPSVEVKVTVRDPANIRATPRPPEPGEVEVELNLNNATVASGVVERSDGVVNLVCQYCDGKTYQIVLRHTRAPNDYIQKHEDSVVLPSDGMQRREIALSHRTRVGANALAEASGAVSRLRRAPGTPNCYLADSASALLQCRLRSALRPSATFDAERDRIDALFETAIQNGAEAQRGDAQRRYGNFLVGTGRPCAARSNLLAAARDPTLQGPQTIRGWLDAVVACIADPDRLESPLSANVEALQDIREAVEEPIHNFAMRGNFYLLDTTIDLFKRLGTGSIEAAATEIETSENAKLNYYSIVRRLLGPWCGVSEPFNDVSRTLRAITKRRTEAACRTPPSFPI